MKKFTALLMILMFAAVMCFANGGTESTDSQDIAGQTIEVAVNYTGIQSDVFKNLVSQFEAESGVNVEVVEYGNDYENTMKTRMASNSLPDVFQTHGWSILRYKEYLMDLRDEPWASDYTDAALGVIRDDDGSIYVLMTSLMVGGTVANLDILNEVGIDPYSIHTWEDFTEACAAVKAAGYTPINNPSEAGLLANIAGTWVSYPGELAEDSEAMLDGSYDFGSYRALLEQYAEWIDAGYFYEDALTINDTDISERFASGQAAFEIGNGGSFLVGCKTLNPYANYVFLPNFASKDGGKEFIFVGEGDTFGIWKDSDHVAASKAFLEFMARPENASTLTASTGYVCALESSLPYDDGYQAELYLEMQDKCVDSDILYENLWDRKYMPSGMWQVFDIASDMLFSDHSEAGIDAVQAYLLENYQSLYI